MEENKGKEASEQNHSDEEQDKSLIMDMLKKHLGDDDNQEEAYKMAREAYEAYKEMGHESSKALEKCESYVEMSKHMAKKEAVAPKEEPKKEEPAAEEPKAKEPKEEEKKESEEKKKLESEVVRLRGEVAKLRESEARTAFESHIDETFKKSGLPMAVTKQFKESIKTVKAKEDFDRLWSVFLEGYKSAPGKGADMFDLPLTTEKVSMTGATGFNIGDFVK